MKKLVILTVIALSSFGLSAKGTPTPDYITTKTGTYFYESVRYGLSSFLVAKTDIGDKVRIDKEDVIAYKKDGRVYELKKAVKNGNACADCTFMELLTMRHGIKVYKQEKVGVNGQVISDIHLYKGDDFILTVDEHNYRHVVDFLSGNFPN